MGSREFVPEPDLVCDICGEKGAMDVYGDYICAGCMDRALEGGQDDQA